MQQREDRRAIPVLPSEYGYERDADGLVVYISGDAAERTEVLRFGEGWTAESVEDTVYEYDRDLMAFGERFFELWRCVFGGEHSPDGTPRSEV